MTLRFLRWLLLVLNAALIICAIGTDVTVAGLGAWQLAGAISLTVLATAMLPYFWTKTRPTS